MAKVKTPFKCFCGHEQDVTYKKPNLFQPTVVSVSCQECDSDYFVKFKKDPKLPADQVGIETRLERMSESLKAILEAQQLAAQTAAKAEQKKKDAFRYGESNVKTS